MTHTLAHFHLDGRVWVPATRSRSRRCREDACPDPKPGAAGARACTLARPAWCAKRSLSLCAGRPLGQAKDAARIRDFILEHRPHVILVGGANLNCRQLLAELTVIRDHILETQPKFFTSR